MRIDITDTDAEQGMAVNKCLHLVVAGDRRLRQIAQCTQNNVALAQAPQGQFADHEGVGQHLASSEKVGKGQIPATQMIDPNRSID